MSPPPPLQRYKLTIAYDGTGYHGWQKQEPPGLKPLRTVAGEVEKAIAQVAHQRVSVVGASRTDAGVHAKGQVAHFDAATTIPIERLAMAINSKLPRDAEIVSAAFAPPDFDAISGATSKQYRYRLFNSHRRPLLKRFGVWHCWIRLDLDRMNDAARRLVGTHDVAGLAAADHGRTTTVRTIFDCFVEAPAVFADEGPEVHIVVTGSGFLYNMVRIIAGTLIEVGRGRFEPKVIDEILSTGKRALAGPTLPPEGLCLEWVKYEGKGKTAAQRAADAHDVPAAGSSPEGSNVESPDPADADADDRMQE